RWSTGRTQAALGIASMAGLPATRAIVCVGPSLSARLASLGATPKRSLGCAFATVQSAVLPIRLWPDEETSPSQSEPVPAAFAATIVAWSSGAVPPAKIPPPSPSLEALDAPR